MRSLRLAYTILGIAIWLLAWPSATASEPIGDGPVYDVVTTRVMYQPTKPFHITDMRYPDKSDFETRTVTIYQPYLNGEPLHNRPVVFLCPWRRVGGRIRRLVHRYPHPGCYR